MVDFKICSIDETWSGLRFTLRKNNNHLLAKSILI
jgi:hypothetical protein